MQTTFYPRLAYRVEGEPVARPAGLKPMGKVTRHPGDWRYAGLRKSSRISWAFAILFSAGVHVGVIWGPGHHKVRPRVAAAPEERVVQMVMPQLPEDEEEKPTELDNELDQAPAVDVPRLADIPTVDVNASFVQPLDLNVPLQSTFDGSKMSAIPLHIATGAKPSGLKNIFDLSQLDRVPEAIAQPAPVFPYEMKKDVQDGQVVVEFIVDHTGVVREAHVTSSTHAGFERVSVEAVMKWRFRPGMKGGKKVSTRMAVPIHFTVTDTES